MITQKRMFLLILNSKDPTEKEENLSQPQVKQTQHSHPQFGTIFFWTCLLSLLYKGRRAVNVSLLSCLVRVSLLFLSLTQIQHLFQLLCVLDVTFVQNPFHWRIAQLQKHCDFAKEAFAATTYRHLTLLGTPTSLLKDVFKVFFALKIVDVISLTYLVMVPLGSVRWNAVIHKSAMLNRGFHLQLHHHR